MMRSTSAMAMMIRTQSGPGRCLKIHAYIFSYTFGFFAVFIALFEVLGVLRQRVVASVRSVRERYIVGCLRSGGDKL